VIASIVIRAKNEAKDIGDALDRISRQIGVSSFETIVVDSGSTDGTVEIARQFDTQIIEIPPESFSFGRALNIGIEAASGEYVIALSAHSLPADNTWLSKLIEPLSDPTVGGVYGRHIPRSNVTALELFGMKLSGVTSHRPRRQNRDMMFSNANSALRRSLTIEQPFNPTLPGGEDFEWVDRIQRRGWIVCYQPTAAVYHSHGESFGKLVRRIIHDQPTIWRLKLGMLDPRVRYASREETRVSQP